MNTWERSHSTGPSPRPENNIMSNVNRQAQSPLFSVIPPEIRNHIFWLALQEYDDPATLYPRDTYYTRPGCLGEKRNDTELLRTCRAVYAETAAIPSRDVEATFHCGDHRRRAPTRPRRWHNGLYARISSDRLSSIKRVRFTAQLFALNANSLQRPFGSGDLKPETVTIVVRYTDWWYWEDDRPLNISTARWKDVKFPSSVKKVVMELETREGRKQELEGIVSGLFERPEDCLYGREDGRSFRLSAREGVREWKWDGPTKFKIDDSTVEMREYAHHPKTETMGYVVKVLTWEVVEGGDQGVAV